MRPDDFEPSPRVSVEPPSVEADDAHRESIIALSHWLETAPGRYVLAWEQRAIDALVADIFGFNAVQLGLAELDALRGNRMPFVLMASEAPPPVRARSEDAAADGANEAANEATNEAVNDGADTAPPARREAKVVISLEDLPFASQSLDLVVLPHALEFARDPHHVLREVERVLMPEGRVIISGFNPVSLWGLRQVVGRTWDSPFLPREGQFLSLPRLKDWLKLLGFEVDGAHFGCYRPPFASERWQSRFGFMERFGDRWWSYGGAIYVVQAVKRVKGMRLVGLAWKDRKRLAPALQPSASRAGDPVLGVRGDALMGEPRPLDTHVEA